MQFASRLDNVETSAIRELFKLLGTPGIISFAGGFPDSAMFDVEGLKEASAKALAEEPGGALQYGATEGYIKTIGLYRSKARHLVEASRMLVELHGGEVPRTRAELEALPGVGRKTANVVLNVAFGEPTMAVDTHIFRVGNRTGLAPGKTPLEVELKLEKRVPEAYRLHAHHWLILHGRYTCVARKPLCWKCAVSPYCDYKPKTQAP